MTTECGCRVGGEAPSRLISQWFPRRPPSNWTQQSTSTLGLGLAAPEFSADQMTQQYPSRAVLSVARRSGTNRRRAAARRPRPASRGRVLATSTASRAYRQGNGTDRHDLLGRPSTRGYDPVSQLHEGGRRAGRVHRQCRPPAPLAPTTLKAHTGRVCGVAFSPDGRELASAGHRRNRAPMERSKCNDDLATEGRSRDDGARLGTPWHYGAAQTGLLQLVIIDRAIDAGHQGAVSIICTRQWIVWLLARKLATFDERRRVPPSWRVQSALCVSRPRSEPDGPRAPNCPPRLR
jgi:hypothetical protein